MKKRKKKCKRIIHNREVNKNTIRLLQKFVEYIILFNENNSS